MTILYTSFDRYPAAKGAATHIGANVRALGRRYGHVALVTPGPDDVPPLNLAPGVIQVVLGCPDEDLLGRVMTFRVKLRALLQRQAFDVVHFRSPLEGYPLALGAAGDARLVYEVNGLPSIEWKYHDPRADEDRLLAKLRHQEAVCLRAAHRVLTVSDVNRRHLESLGARDVHVIRNGVDLADFPFQEPPLRRERRHLLYFGTLSPWQGVETLIDAAALAGAELVVAGPVSRRRREELTRRAERLQVPLTLTGPLSRPRLVAQLHAADACVVPLADVDRNTVQGCCPLKLVEALAAGCPVIASDLPVVREIVNDADAVLVPPGDPAAIAQALSRLDPCRARAGRLVAERLTWSASTDQLLALYDDMLVSKT